MTDFYQHLLAKAHARLRIARAEHETFAANMDTSDRSAQHLTTLRLKVEEAEREVSNAERALEGVQRMQRAIALGM